MIRLPTFRERAKIATPNKAGTLLGVSPFSSTRNVMAKVQDTSCAAPDARSVRKYKTIPCKGCGGPVRTSLKKPYCSHECRNKHKPIQHQKLKVACCVCGMEVVRRAYGNQEKFCCSLGCQRNWALFENRGGGGTRSIDWIKRSEKAKSKWKKAQSKIRSLDGSNWVLKMCLQNYKEKEEHTQDWVKKKCQSAANSLRFCLSKKQKLFVEKEVKVESWSKFCKKQINRSYRKFMAEEKTWVRAKCVATSGNWKRKQKD